MKSKIPFLIILILLLMSGCVSENIRISETGQNQIYLPLVHNSSVLVGVEIAYVDWDRIGHLYQGDIAKYSLAKSSVPINSLIYDWSFYDRTIKNEGSRYLTFRGRDISPLCKFPDYHTTFLNEWLPWALAGIERYYPETGTLYVQFWNEPDTDFEKLDYHFGCIGEDYAAGALYATYYNQFYATVRSQFPNVVILSGELGWPNPNFISGMVDYIIKTDGIAFHYYAYCNSNYQTNVTNITSMIQSLTNKRLYLTETSAIYDGEPNPDCEEYKARYVDWITHQYQYEMVILFTLNRNGWMNSWLEGNPAYDVYVESVK